MYINKIVINEDYFYTINNRIYKKKHELVIWNIRIVKKYKFFKYIVDLFIWN